MKPITSIILLIALMLITSCNNDEPKFSSSQIQNALFEMKGTYHGNMSVSYYQGNDISEGNECTAWSKDSLTVNMDLALMALAIPDENIASRLREIGEIQVKAAYEFSQMDEQIFNFVLHPDDVTCTVGHDAKETVRIVFAQNFGGDADCYNNDIIFNLSPKELWVGDKEYESFRQLVYHFRGSYN